MKQIKGFMLIVILFLKFGLNAQEISFSKELLSTNDKNIQDIMELWKSNINDNIKGFVLKDKSIVAQHWSIDEVKKGWIDIAKDNFSSVVPIYLYGETITFDVRKITDELYEIRSLILQTDSIGKNVLLIFRTNAVRTENGFKLSNYFFQNKNQLNKVSTNCIDYYFDNEFVFDKKYVEESDKFLNDLVKLYNFEVMNKITYVVGSSLSSANRLLGFDFTIRNVDHPYAAYFLRDQRIIVTSQINHKHELTHSVFETLYPNAHRLFQEGVATYYGGSLGLDYSYDKIVLKKIVIAEPNIDLSNVWELEFIDKNTNTNTFYTIGAVLIEIALEQGGTKKVNDLFKHPSNDWKLVVNEVLGISIENFNETLKQHLTK
jgi:hypothetical protein